MTIQSHISGDPCIPLYLRTAAHDCTSYTAWCISHCLYKYTHLL